MFTFLPALILLLLHGPSTLDRSIGQTGSQADIGAIAPRMPVHVARGNRAWIAELLSRLPGEHVLAALVMAPTPEPQSENIASVSSVPGYQASHYCRRASASHRDRDGPSAA
jgi:hypothetical protein